MSRVAEIVLKTSIEQKKAPPSMLLDELSQLQLDQQIEELGIKVAEGQGAKAERKELHMLLNHILSYPSTELAQIHRNANRLGQLDQNKEDRYNKISNMGQQEFTHLCKCCGFIVQDESLSICPDSVQNIHNLGISTFLYFKTIQNLSILLGIMFVVYSTYSLATNLKAANIDINGNYSSEILNFLSISLGSKQLYSSEEKIQMYVIGAWIGLAMLLLWSIAFLGLKYYQKESEVAILLQTKSVSEYTLVIEKIPTGMTKVQIQRLFKHYLQELKQVEDIGIDEITVQKYNEGQPFYINQQQFNDSELAKELAMTHQYLGLFKSWIEGRRWRSEFNKSEKYRNRKYKQYQRVMERKKKVVMEITKKIKDIYRHKNKQNLTTAFVTFATNHQKNCILDYNSKSFFSFVQHLVPCLRNKNRFVVDREGEQFQVEISPAPDPEDIIWSNIGVSRSEIWGRKLVTYSITALILAISFVITYSLSRAQVSYQGNKLLSVLISVSISVINLIIGLVIEVLTGYERDFTMTNYQISLHIKTVLAQLINCIFIPIMANYFIKQNIYGENGLIEDVLILGITNSLVYPLGKALNPAYLLRYFYAKYRAMAKNKLDLHQFELNQLFQKQQFEIGYEYIFVVNLFIFTCFFVSLQPILPVFALVGLLLIYWVEKYNLFHRSQRPVPGTPVINTTVSQLIYFGAVAYTLGSMTWANFLPDSQFKAALIPNIFALAASAIIFLLPYETIFRRIFKNKRMPEVSYSQNRIFFTSEYDRLNPSTSEAGVREYYSFLQQKIKELQSKDQDYKLRLSYQLQFNNRPNFYKQPEDTFNSASKYEGKAVINNILKKQSKNSMTPQMIATVLLKDRHNNKPLISSQIKKSLARIKIRKQFETEERKQQDTSIQPEVLEESESEHHMKGLEKIQSVEMENMGKVSGFSYHKQSRVEESECQQYLPELPQVQSFILQAQSREGQPAHLPAKRERQSKVQVSFDSGAVSVRSTEKELIRSLQEMDVCEEVVNRFSLNSQIMLPMCIESQDSLIFQSQIRFQNLASFQ